MQYTIRPDSAHKKLAPGEVLTAIATVVFVLFQMRVRPAVCEHSGRSPTKGRLGQQLLSQPPVRVGYLAIRIENEGRPQPRELQRIISQSRRLTGPRC